MLLVVRAMLGLDDVVALDDRPLLESRGDIIMPVLLLIVEGVKRNL